MYHYINVSLYITYHSILTSLWSCIRMSQYSCISKTSCSLFTSVLSALPVQLPMPGCWALNPAIIMQKFPGTENPICLKIPCYIKRRNKYWKHKDLVPKGYTYSLESNQNLNGLTLGGDVTLNIHLNLHLYCQT